ncbi:glycoside hydrolase family 3 C-terminal domain-containing protein [Spirochaetia bacterium 38H-sp]|uniref:Glycoside hydrolase family 3 C-terminal domain-containing protein n=1 Tax=Rarispira pelagica TaxID=3141764 RepID=A0ABU9UDZ4_9SPIR
MDFYFNDDAARRIDEDVRCIVSSLSLHQKVMLLSGKDYWSTWAFPEAGLDAVVMTDGPNGVRIGNESSSRPKDGFATAFPTGIAMASCWDVDLMYKIGAVLAHESLANDCDVLLGPCVNIVRFPLGGRNFETFSEDPLLAGKLGASYVRGLQDNGVAACLKHFALNNQEHERTRVSVEVEERALREIYLRVFEIVIREANPWTVMCSYNRIRGEYASSNSYLLRDVLKGEWAYDGVVMSDWGANHEVYGSLAAGLDLEMPGPALYRGYLLEEAVKNWQIDESVVDEAVERLVRLAKRLAFYREKNKNRSFFLSDAGQAELAFRVAAESCVLLKNENSVLPLDTTDIKRLAVLGPCADVAVYGGGGSSIVNCARTTTPLDGLREFLPDDVEIVYHEGASNRVRADRFSFAGLEVSWDDKSGFIEEYFPNRLFLGEPVSVRHVEAIDFWKLFPPVDEIDTNNFSVRWKGKVRAKKSGDYVFKLSYQGDFSFYIDGNCVVSDSNWKASPPYPFFTVKKYPVSLTAGREYEFCVELANATEDERSAMILQALYMESPEEQHKKIADAVSVAKSCDRVLVFLGHPVGYETEGADRDDMRLPGAQDKLVEELCKVRDDVVVVLNTGSPVEMPWIDDVAAVIQAHFYGQEGGRAVAAVLTGDVNPSGRLTVTYPMRYEDNPAYINYPGAKTVNYGEGIFVGYRYYMSKNIPVLFPFGHGLSYTSFSYSALNISGNVEEGIIVSVDVENTGDVDGAEVVQVYVRDIESSEVRPSIELAGFSRLELQRGEKKRVEIALDKRSFMFYSDKKKDWLLEKGDFEILVGASCSDIRLRGNVTV